MLKSVTQIRESSNKPDMSALIEESATVPKSITMDDFEKVTVNVKAIAVKDPTQIGDETEQDILIVDKTGTANVSLWEDNVQTRNGFSFVLIILEMFTRASLMKKTNILLLKTSK